MPILLHAIVALAYLGAAGAVWRAAVRAVRSDDRLALIQVRERRSTAVYAVVAVAWLVHAFLLREAALTDGQWRFGFALALSATMWLAVALFWIESLLLPLASLWIVILPIAAVCALLPLLVPGSIQLGRLSGADGSGGSPWLPIHLAVALAAYGLLTIAAIHALFMAALDRWLHRERGSGWSASAEADDDRRVSIERGMLAALPPLLTLERVLFRLIAAGFVLLTLTVMSGAFFSETLFGRPLRLDHKTVFTLVAWLVFGGLLIGRAVRGWRGRLALSWTLSGFAMLILAYAGSRFVLEVVLHRV